MGLWEIRDTGRPDEVYLWANTNRFIGTIRREEAGLLTAISDLHSAVQAFVDAYSGNQVGQLGNGYAREAHAMFAAILKEMDA